MDQAKPSAEPKSATVPRSSIEHLVNAINAHESIQDPDSPRKRQKRSPPPNAPAEVQLSKKGKACTACRKLKVKCDSTERGDIGCSRCQRLGLECVNVKKLRLALEGDVEPSNPSLQRLERAVSEILQKLKMPPLEMYTKSSTADAGGPAPQMSDFQNTRENSREPGEGEREVAPAPMGSLYEVTQLNTLRSRLRKETQGNRTSRRNMEADLISQNLLSENDAEELLTTYKTTLARYLFATTMPEETTLQTVRESSTLLFTAVMLVSSSHIPGKEIIHAVCHKHFLDLVATTMFERLHTLDDIRALCIAAFWQPDMSWKLSGLAVRMATELNLHQSFYSAFYSQNITPEEQSRALEKARVWYLLYVLDHHFSIAYGRPPVTAELLPIKEWETFVNSPWCTLSDRRLVSQVSLFVILSRAYEVFGLERERLMGGDDASLLMHLRFTEDIRAWKDRWHGLVLPDKFIGDYPYKGVEIHYHFASLVLNSLALRGRPLDNTISTTLPASLRPVALRAIESAHSVLHFFLEEKSYRDSLVGVPLYLHSMIAFAVVFLMKLSHRWHQIGVSIDPETRTKPMIEGIIQLLKDCKAGSGHMAYSMAKGFERMLKSSGNDDINAVVNGRDTDKKRKADGTSERDRQHPQQHHHNQRRSEGHYRTEPPLLNPSVSRASSQAYPGSTDTNTTSPHNDTYHTTPLTSTRPGDASPFPTPSTADTHANAASASPYFNDHNLMSGAYNDYTLGLQDDMLWSAGMGYDLLHTNRGDTSDFGSAGTVMGLYDYTHSHAPAHANAHVPTQGHLGVGGGGGRGDTPAIHSGHAQR